MLFKVFLLILATASAADILNVKNCPGVVADGDTDDTASIHMVGPKVLDRCPAYRLPLRRCRLGPREPADTTLRYRVDLRSVS